MFIAAEDAATIPALQSGKAATLGIPQRLEVGHGLRPSTCRPK
jgi:hypothetical protein